MARRRGGAQRRLPRAGLLEYSPGMRLPSTPAAEEHVGLRFLSRPGAHARAPLVVFVHGRAGNREVMWSFERAVPTAAAVVAFEAFLPDPLGGFSWWDFEAPGSKREAIRSASKRLSFALERFVDLEGLEPSHTVALGFSQGAVLLSDAMLAGEVALDGLGLLAGLVPTPEEKPHVIGHPRVLVAHGVSDEVIRVERARQGVELLRSLGLDVTYVEDAVGHKVGIEGTRALKAWLHEVLG